MCTSVLFNKRPMGSSISATVRTDFAREDIYRIHEDITRSSFKEENIKYVENIAIAINYRLIFIIILINVMLDKR